MHKTTSLLLALAAITLLPGCAAWNDLTSYADQTSTMTHQQRSCAELKRKIIFYKNNPGYYIEWNSPSQHAQLIREYNENHCADPEKATTPPAAK